MFDRIAPYYDFLNRLLSLGIDTRWRKKAIAKLDPGAHHRILDVATGTADVALTTARHLPQVEHITGVDISREMLDIGRGKVAKANLSQTITLEEGDSEDLPFPDDHFDAITVAFGVRNFGDLEKGLTEMRRVLRPGGRLVVLEFSHPRVFPLKQMFNLYFRYMLPAIGRVTSKDPKAYRYLYESVQAFPDGSDFVNILSRVGYKANTCEPLTFGICSIYTGEK
jgi:demethylmenaquinone methyltransferase/2-methoxy-6-polyprenyl-1,4-benzoquinol methylase